MNKRMLVRAAAAAAAFICVAGAQAGSADGGGSALIEKKGTFDIFVVEANPVVFKGRLWLMEYLRDFKNGMHHRENLTGDSYFRFLDMTDLKTVTPPFAHGFHFGNAFVHGGRVYVTATASSGGDSVYLTESDDLVNWTKPRVILSGKGWKTYNTTMCRAGDTFVLSFELGRPLDMVGVGFTMFFATSKDLKTWTVVEGAAMGRDRYTGAPMLRYHAGWFYFFHLERDERKAGCFVTRVMRSRDLRTWELSPQIVLAYGDEDRRLHPLGRFSEAEKAHIAAAKNVNASDLDMCEYGGRLRMFYSWGDQRGNEFSALAEAACTERAFCESFFPPADAPADTVRLAAGKTQVYVAPDACAVSRLAADELSRFLGGALGGDVPVTNAFLAGYTALVVGDGAETRAAGIDVTGLPRDAGVIRTRGGRVYIAGRDDTGRSAADIARSRTSGIWANMYERGSVFAVYEFLERFAGVRFYFPGRLGTVVPRHDRIDVPRTDLLSAPDYTYRDYSAWQMGAWFDAEHAKDGRQIMHHRHRLHTAFIPCSHGLNEFRYLDRFGKTHPEYFQMLENGKRNVDPSYPQPGQLCHTSKIWDEIYADAKSFLTGEPPDRRGIPANKGWTSHRTGAFGWNCNTREIAGLGKFVDIMPQDAFQPCHCANCRKVYRREKGSSYASDLVWGNVAKVCNRLKAEGIDGTVTMMGYTPYKNPPDFPLPDNLRVMVARTGPWSAGNESSFRKEVAEIRAWAEKIGKKVWLWNYPCKFRGEFPDIPEHCPRLWGRYYKTLSPWIFGAYAQNTSTRWLYGHLDVYVYAKVCWDNATDVDALLEEYYTLMYGKGRDDMKSFFETLEEKWRLVVAATAETPLGPVVVRPSEYRLFTELYSPAVLSALEASLDAAARKTGAGTIEAERVALMRRELFDPLAARAARYLASIDVKAALARRAARPGGNLLANGDFTAGVRGWNGRVEHDPSDGVVKPGCVKVVSDGAGNDAYQHFNRDGRVLKPDTEYRLSFFVRLDGVEALKGGKWCGVFGNVWAGGNVWSPRFFGHTGTTGWIYQELEFTTCSDPEKLKKAYVSLKIREAKGTVRFDDVVLEEIER